MSNYPVTPQSSSGLKITYLISILTWNKICRDYSSTNLPQGIQKKRIKYFEKLSCSRYFAKPLACITSFKLYSNPIT